MPACSECGASAVRHGVRERRVRDLEASGAPVERAVAVQRWRCTRCRSCFDELPPGARRGSLASVALRDAVASACFEAGYAAAGARFGIDEKTARARWAEWAALREDDLPRRAPEYIGLHLARVGGVEATVVSDVRAGALVDVLPGAGVGDVVAWFDRLADSGTVLWAASSVHQPFRQALRECAPGASLAVCPEHARASGLRAFLGSFRAMCRALGRGPSSNARERPRLFATPRSMLGPGQREAMEGWDEAVLGLYEAKERFVDALGRGSPRAARAALDEALEMCRALPGARAPRDLLESWGNEFSGGVGDPDLGPFVPLLGELGAAWARRRPPLPFDLARGLAVLRDGPRLAAASGEEDARRILGVRLDEAARSLAA